MVAAAGIEGGIAGRALGFVGNILLNAHLISTGAAQHGKLGPLGLRPDFDRMISQLLMTILAGIVGATTFHFDGDDVEGSSIVGAARLGIDIDSANLRARGLHR